MVALRAASSNFNNSAVSSIAVTLPSGWAAGDAAVIVVGQGNVGTFTYTLSGWAEHFEGSNSGDSGGFGYVCYSRILQSGDSNPTVTASDTGKYAWACIAMQPDSGGTLSIEGTPASGIDTTTSTSHTPPSESSSNTVASVIACSYRASANAATAITTTPPTNWTEPASGDTSTNSGTTSAARQVAAAVSYRLAQTGTISPGALTNNVSTYANKFHLLVLETVTGGGPVWPPDRLQHAARWAAGAAWAANR